MAVGALWNAQRSLRRNPILLPCAVVGLAFLMIVCYHTMFERDSHIQAFLIVISMTMLPLSYVDASISDCSDPIGMFNKFGFRVMLMHAGFLSVRAISMMSPAVLPDIYNNWVNITAAITAIIAIVVGFQKQLASIHQCVDVLGLFLLAFLVGEATELVTNGSLVMDPALIGAITADYIEVLAFVPAALAIIILGKKDAKLEMVDPQECQRSAWAFAFLVIGFYFVEDMVTACLGFKDGDRIFESFAHVLHFVVLVDFGVFVIASAHDPDNTKRGTMLSTLGGNFFADTV